MKARSILPLLIAVFVAGVLFGIWMDWSAWKNKLRTQSIKYELEPYQTANLLVHPGDRISLVKPDGTGTGLAMNFLGYIPCTPGTANTDTCLIDKNSKPGAYRFLCSSTPPGYSCPDPGVQQGPTLPMDYGYGEFVATDFVHLFGASDSHEEKKEGANPIGGKDAPDPIHAWVSCDTAKNLTVLQYFNNGKPANAISGSVDQTVYWASNQPFTLAVSGYPAGFCSEGDPGVSGQTTTQCTLKESGKSVTYAVTASSCGILNGATLSAN